MIAGLIFLFGLALGSFLNVCIYRLPKGQSVIHPRSRCPHCGQPIAAYDNIPLISYLLLRGQCRACQAPISTLYPVVEGMTGLALALAYLQFGWTLGALKVAVLAAALIVLTFTDLRDRLLPDAVTYPGMGVGFLFALWVPVEDGTAALLLGRESWHPALLSLADGLLGALLGAGLLFVLGEVWYRLRWREPRRAPRRRGSAPQRGRWRRPRWLPAAGSPLPEPRRSPASPRRSQPSSGPAPAADRERQKRRATGPPPRSVPPRSHGAPSRRSMRAVPPVPSPAPGRPGKAAAASHDPLLFRGTVDTHCSAGRPIGPPRIRVIDTAIFARLILVV